MLYVDTLGTGLTNIRGSLPARTQQWACDAAIRLLEAGYGNWAQTSKGLNATWTLTDAGVKADIPVASGGTPIVNSGTANATALNALGAALRTDHTRYELTLPRCVVNLESSAWLLQNFGGLRVRAGGANIGQGNEPDDSSWLNIGDQANSQFVGTEIAGYDLSGLPMWELTDVGALIVEGLSLRGDGANKPEYGILIGKATGGLGPTTHLYLQTAIQNCVQAINAGRVSSTGGGYVAQNCSEIMALQLQVKRCTYGFRVEHNQALNFALYQPQFSETTHALYQNQGGNWIVDQAQLFDVDNLLTVIAAGSAGGTSQLRGIRVDGSSVRTVIFNGASGSGSLAIATIQGFISSTGNRDAGTNARVSLSDQHFVALIDATNLSRTSGGTGHVFTSTGTGKKAFTLERSRIPGLARGVPNYAAVVGSLAGETYYRLTNNHSDGSGVAANDGRPLVDREWPRINGRASSHRMAFESHCSATTQFDGCETEFTGTGAAITSVAGGGNNPGVVRLLTGTTTTGGSALGTRSTLLTPGRGEIRMQMGIRIPAASDGTNTFDARFGLFDTRTGVTPTHVIGFRYTHGTYSGNFNCETRAAGTPTNTDSGVAATANTWFCLEIIVAPDGSSVRFFIDGTLVATHTTNIPTSGGQNLGFLAAAIKKSAGTTTTGLDCDFYFFEYVLSNITFTTTPQ